MDYTNNYNLVKPAKSQKSWDTLLNDNFDKIDNEIKNTNDKIGDISKLDSINIVDELKNHTSQLADMVTVNVKSFGAKGDNEQDDTQAFKEAIAYLKSAGGGKLLIPIGVYKISDSLLIDFSNLTIEGTEQGNTVLKFYNKYILDCISLKGTAIAPIENIIIKNVTIDFTEQLQKGGTVEEPFLTTPNTSFLYANGIFGRYVSLCTISNCKINDVYGNGIRFWHSSNCTIENNFLYNCSGSNIGTGSGEYDSYGDGICFFRSFHIIVKNNTLINERKFMVHVQPSSCNKDVYGLPCGRSGLEFEYAISNDAPYSDLFISGNEIGNVFENNFVYGYTKGIHLESEVSCSIINNTLIHNHIGLIFTGNNDDSCIISHNTFNNDGVGPAPQSGYHQYYCGIAYTDYGDSKNTQITNNLFYGDGRGVGIGRNYLTISNNIFKTKSRHIFVINDSILSDVVISNNEFTCENFEDTEIISTYDCKNFVIANNKFNNFDTNTFKVGLYGSDMIVTQNIFANVYLSLEGGNPKKIIITNNKFEGNYNKNIINAPSNLYNSDISHNIFEYFDSPIKAIYIQNVYYSNISDNQFILNGQDINSEIQYCIYSANIRECNMNNNTMNCTVDSGTLIRATYAVTNFRCINNRAIPFTANKIIYNNTNGGTSANSIIQHNIGQIIVPGDKPSGIPTSGIWNRGDKRYDIFPTAGGYEGYVCVISGEPGIWKGFGLIQS